MSYLRDCLRRQPPDRERRRQEPRGDRQRDHAGTHFLPPLRQAGVHLHLHDRRHAQEPETGFVEYDKDHCASCYMCIMSCPFGILKYDSIRQKEIMKCNMCVHRSEDGKTPMPMCVEKCPMHAITLVEI